MVPASADDGPDDPRIGPQEERELSLMLEGRKPLAVFWETEGEGTIPDALFSAAVKAGRIVRHERAYERAGRRLRVVYFALASEFDRIAAAETFLDPVFKGERTPAERDEMFLGNLLGYSDTEIRAFLARAGGLRNEP